MRRLASVLGVTLAVIAFFPSSARADSIGPNCGTCQGSIYTLTSLGLAPTDLDGVGFDTWRILLTIDTSGYNGGGAAIDSVAVKVSSNVNAAKLVSAPGSLDDWQLVPGGVNGGGCQYNSNNAFECADYKAVAGVGAAVGGTLSWIFDIDVDSALFTDSGDASIKARYVSSAGNKVGNLVSEGITLGPPTTVPEPGRLLLMASAGGFATIAAWRVRRRRESV